MIESTKTVLAVLADTGLLLVQDKRLPNVVTTITGESPATSWWSHPKGGEIFAVLAELDDHPDVAFIKLLNRKVTLVHRQLWPALLAIVSHAEPWQMDGLSAAAQRLLTEVNESAVPVLATGPVVKELETRLLVHAEQVHGQSGKHELALQSWALWARKRKVKPLRSLAAAREEMDRAIERIGAKPSALPWPSAR